MALSTLAIVLAIVFVVGVLPLYLIVRIFGGNITLLKALGIKIVAAIVSILLALFLGSLGPLIIAIVMILIYKAAFNLSILKAFFAWLLEGIVMAAIVFLLVFFGLITLSAKGLLAIF
ncbi:hypothetical protein KY349_03910 [Candidatus Woesearchaeota archaeon]|nr:hypothetical protein [Candidatus Woesearchaeota archaeon]